MPNIVLVTGRGKNAIEDHFDVATELEAFLESRGKKDLADEIRKISDMIQVSYVRQGEPLGLGHAVLVTEMIVIGLIGVGLDQLLFRLTTFPSVRWGYER